MILTCALVLATSLVASLERDGASGRVRTAAADIRAAATPVYVVERAQECEEDLERFCKGKASARARWQCLLPKVTEVYSEACEALVIEAQKFNLAHGEAAELPDACAALLASACSGRESTAAEVCLENFEAALPPACHGANAYQLQATLDDIRMDAPLESACHGDIGKHCAHVRAGQGRLLVCLRRHMEDLTTECKEEEFQELIFASTNINFNPMLIKNCDREMQSLCADIEPGKGRIIRCLEEKRSSVSMRAACRTAVTEQLAAEASDARLNFHVAKQCEWEVKNFCFHVPPGHGRLHNCLFNHKNELTRPCRRAEFQAVNKKMVDIDIDEELHSTCQADIDALCVGVPSGAVHRCLRLHLEILSEDCQRAEFAELAEQLEDVRVNPDILAKCGSEGKEYCTHVTPGGGRLIACLNQNRFMANMGAGCNAVLTSAYDTKERMMHTVAMSSSPACQKDVARLCKDVAVPSTRSMHVCLTEHKDELSPLCRKLEKGGRGGDALDAELGDNAENAAAREHSADWRLSLSKFLENRSTTDERLLLARSAQRDVERVLSPCAADFTGVCNGVEPGGGRMLHCLSKHQKEGDLSIPCHSTLRTVDLASVASITSHGPRDVSRVLFKCAREAKEHCTVRNSTVLECLQRAARRDAAQLSQPCSAGLHRDALVVKEHGESPAADMVSMCVEDIQAFCADVPEGRLQRMHVVRCLNAARASGKPFSDKCTASMSQRLSRLRKTRQATGDHKIAAVCKSDLKRYCSDALPVRALLRDCLVNNKGRLSYECFDAEFERPTEEVGSVAWVLVAIMVLGVGAVASICISRLLSRAPSSSSGARGSGAHRPMRPVGKRVFD